MASVLDYNEAMPSFADLPMEIILHIFRFLDHTNLQSAAATCMRWREALFDPEFNRKTIVRFMRVCLSDRLPTARVFLKCERPFSNFLFEEVTFGQVHELMEHLGKTATDVTFDRVDIEDKQFYAILRQFPNLRSLKIVRCSTLFMSGAFLDSNDERGVTDLSLTSIKNLSLRYNQYLSDAILLRLTALMKAIESLDLAGCHIAYHNAVQHRFYPDETSSPSESILTFKFILRVLERHRQYLRELNLSNTLIGASAMEALSQCELESGGLQLMRLHLASCRQLNTLSIGNFLKMQPKLIVLDLSDTCIKDDALELLVTATPLLQELSIANCNGITNQGAAFLGHLKHLRKLNISRCQNITSGGITMGIAQATNTVMQELHIAYLSVCEECVKTVSRNLPELRALFVNHCVNAITDDSLQCIIQNLRWLRLLSLENCFKITDAALTGINVAKLKPTNTNSMEDFHPSPNSFCDQDSLSSSVPSIKISLRSKAEEEIVCDAQRKRAMFAAYELNLIDEMVIEGVNIQQLSGLRELNLKDCNKITDVSLKYGLKFLELRSLSLSNCQQISLLGIENLVLNCPSLEKLDLSNCDNITDKAIQVITSKLRRLTTLHINGCTQLTDHAIDAILVNCKHLHTLSVYRCRRIYTDIEERLADVPTLRDLNTDSCRSFDNLEIFRLKKRFDY